MRGWKKIKDAGEHPWAHDEEADCTEFGNTCNIAGQYVDPDDEQATCKNCPLGFQVSVTSGRSRCSICPVGKYQNELQQEACKKCDEADKLCNILPGVTTSIPRSVPHFLSDLSNIDVIATTTNAKTQSVSSCASDGVADDSESLDQQKIITTTIYSLLFVMSTSVVLIHRYLPPSWRIFDILFAKAHFIEDGHSVRRLDTRLGTSFNAVLAFASCGLFVMVFYADPNTMESTSLVPSASLREIYLDSNKSFGSLNVTIRTYAPSKSSDMQTARCNDSVLREFTSGLHCTSFATEEKEAKKETSDITGCRIEMGCSTKSGSLLIGTQQILFGLPDIFQTIEYFVTNSFWDKKIPPITIHNTLMPEQRNSVLALGSTRVLVGTKTKPSTINIEATRSIRNDTRAGLACDTRGLQLSWIDEQRVDAVSEGTKDGRHYVSVAFHVQSATYLHTLEDKLSFEKRVGTVLTYFLSAIAFLKIVKIVVQALVDGVLTRRPLSEQPEDVQIRYNILNEVDCVSRGNERKQGSSGAASIQDIEMIPIGGDGAQFDERGQRIALLEVEIKRIQLEIAALATEVQSDQDMINPLYAHSKKKSEVGRST